MRTLEIRKHNTKETRRWLPDRWEIQDMETNKGYLEALNIESSIKESFFKYHKVHVKVE